MLRMKMIAGLTLVAAVLMVVSSTALAAPGAQSVDTATPTVTATVTAAPIVGTIQTINITTTNGVTSVIVTLTGKLDGKTYTQTYTLAEAESLGLVTLVNNQPAVDTTKIGTDLTFTPPAPTVTPTPTSQNPVSALIATFFGLDYSLVDSFHQDGSGYGVIAQACWMSFEVKGDTSLCSDILKAKQSGDYSAIQLPNGETPTNWGQFKKAVQEKGQNLGSIISGHAESILTPTPTVEVSPEPVVSPAAPSLPGNGNGNGNGNGHGNAFGHGNGQGHGPHIH